MNAVDDDSCHDRWWSAGGDRLICCWYRRRGRANTLDIHLFSIDMLIGSGGSVNPDAERQTFFSLFRTRQQNKRETTKNHRRFVTGSPCPNAFSGPATNNSGTKMYTRCIRVSVRSIISAQQQQQQQQQQWNRCPGTATRRSDRGMRFTSISSTTKSIGWFSQKKFHSFHQQVDSLFN